MTDNVLRKTSVSEILEMSDDETCWIEDLVRGAWDNGEKHVAQSAARELRELPLITEIMLLDKILQRLQVIEKKNSDGWDAYIQINKYLERLKAKDASKLEKLS